MSWTELEERYIDLLPYGRENALSDEYFCTALGCDIRTLLLISQDLMTKDNIHERVPVCLATTNPAGIYLGVTPDEVQQAAKEYMAAGNIIIEEGESMLQIADCMVADIMDEVVEEADSKQAYEVKSALDETGTEIEKEEEGKADPKEGAVSG